MSRKMARAGVMQALYDMAINKDYDLARLDLFLCLPQDDEELDNLSGFLQNKQREGLVLEEGRFTQDEEDLIRDQVPRVLEVLEDLDKMIESKLRNWTLDRLALVDLTILRLACFEIAYDQVPIPVAINEAVNLAKSYSSDDSSRFINGILSSIIKDVEDNETPEN